MQAPSKNVCVICMQEVTIGIYIIVPSFTQRSFYRYQVFTWKEATCETIVRTSLLLAKKIVGQQELESPVVLLANAVNFRACTYAL
jgi:hypothetical protein